VTRADYAQALMAVRQPAVRNIVCSVTGRCFCVATVPPLYRYRAATGSEDKPENEDNASGRETGQGLRLRALPDVPSDGRAGCRLSAVGCRAVTLARCR